MHLRPPTGYCTNVYPRVPMHNNNQPFVNVNLAVTEVELEEADNEDGLLVEQQQDNERVTLYSLYEQDDEMMEDGGGDEEFREDLKFIPNEYGFLELMEEDDDDEDDENKSEMDESEEEDDEDEEEDRDGGGTVVSSCVTCGCFGMAGEFHDGKHCTYDCSVIARVSEGKRLLEASDEDEDDEEEEEDDDDEENKRMRSDDDSCESSSSSCSSWSSDSGRGTGRSSAEDERGEVVAVVPTNNKRVLRCAPLRLFGRNGIPANRNPFRVHDLLEAIDPEHQSLVCPCVVVEVIGFRVLLKFIGYPDKYEFWANADSPNLFRVKWAVTQQQKQVLVHFHGPPEFCWDEFINDNPHCRVAPETCFKDSSVVEKKREQLLRVGMKLEAVDIRNNNLVCVATVSCVLGDRFLIHFDSWDSLYDYWTELTSPFVHPVGYCASKGIDITPPHCYENAAEFEWDEYLRSTNSAPVPEQLFRPLPPVGFKVGHHVEVVDKRSPRLLRRATITEVDDHFVTLHFDGLDSRYDYKAYELSPDIHPVGWGSHTGHPVADDSDHDDDEEDEEEGTNGHNGGGGENNNVGEHQRFPVCPNHRTCRSVCSSRGPNFPVHSSVKHCPYSPANLASDNSAFTDRVVVFEDKYYDLGGGPTDQDAEEEEEERDVKPDVVDVKPDVTVKQEKIEKSTPSPSPRVVKHHHHVPVIRQSSTPIDFNDREGKVAEIPTRGEILKWSHERVSALVQGLCSNLPTADKVAEQFRTNLIDGESFLMLTQGDITDALGIKLGPAVKIYNLIRLIELNN